MENYKICLAGNPNSGKTTLFNALTGASQYVGNWPGVTVEKKSGKVRGQKDIELIDLPGIYSLSSYTLEERIARDFLLNEQPDVIINIVDGTNLERNLYLTTQLLELNIPVVVAVNMADVIKRRGDKFNEEKLSSLINCPVVRISALKNEGTKELIATALDLAKKKKDVPQLRFCGAVEHALAHIEDLIRSTKHPDYELRWQAIKIFEKDSYFAEKLPLSAEQQKTVDLEIKAVEEELDDDAESIIISERYNIIETLMEGVYKAKRQGLLSVSDKIDRVVTNRILALPIFVVVMFLVYYISISTIGTMATDWVNDVLFTEIIPVGVSDWLTGLGASAWFIGLVVDGIIAGVGAVLGFLPQMIVLFLLLSVLEEVGYMARIAFIMDRIFRRFGLSGKSFIPMLIGSGCSVPGIMASRTIENQRDRRITIMTTSFIPCGAKLPIIALFAGALFAESSLVATSAYFIGVAAVVISGIILKKTKPFRGDVAPFVMELPAYHIPKPGNILRSTWERASSFVVRAGTIILASSIVLWFLQAFGFEDGKFMMLEDNNASILASIGNFVAPIFKPLGFGHWKAAVATFTGLIAKENVVGTFGVLYGFSEVAEDGQEIWNAIALDYTALTAYSFMLFNLLCAPCFAAIGAIKREMVSRKWTWATIGYMTVFAYFISFIVYQLGLVFTGSSFKVQTFIALLVLAFILFMLFRSDKKKIDGLKPVLEHN